MKDAAKRPHIIVFSADQLRFDCLSAYGAHGPAARMCEFVSTPNLDALALESVVFDKAYCATPLCTPTRTAIATGRWPHETGVIVNGHHNIPPENDYGILDSHHETIYELLDQAGYALTHAGVKHVFTDPPLSKRFSGADLSVDQRSYQTHLAEAGLAVPESDPRYSEYKVPFTRFVDGRYKAFESASARLTEPVDFDAEHFRDLYWANEVVRRIDDFDTRRPQALFFECWAPHPPSFVPEPYFSRYPTDELPMPPLVGEWQDGTPATYLAESPGQRALGLLRRDFPDLWSAYLGLVSLVDEAIGRVIVACKKSGIWDDALVLFYTDHGESLGQRQLMQKMTAYEESAHVPLFLKPPRSTGAAVGDQSSGAQSGSGRRRNGVVSHLDIFPTIVDYAGLVESTAGRERWGRSLRAQVEGSPSPEHDVVYMEYNGNQTRGFPWRAITDGRLKYVLHLSGEQELYDRSSDPLEQHNLMQQEHAPDAEPLQKRLVQWMRETGDVFDDSDVPFHPIQWRQIRRSRAEGVFPVWHRLAGTGIT